MKRILTIVGARPQIIKSAALSRAIATEYASSLHEELLHTGQHYDENMSGCFFRELGIAPPIVNLEVRSSSHGEQTAKMLTGIENILQVNNYDGVVVYGDTNSTLAGALAASKLGIPLFHIEAGLRSYNMAMPEEQNRIVADHIANICFAPTLTAMRNLECEGIASSNIYFAGGRKKKAILSGDVMYDNTLYYSRRLEQPSLAMQALQLSHGCYILATIHRNYNADSPARFSTLLHALSTIADQHNTQIVIPLHPRTAKQLHLQEHLSNHLCFIPPVSYFDMLWLEFHAQMIMTDSGGVQKEAFFLQKPCVVLRPETEWIELTDHGAACLTGTDAESILSAYETMTQSTPTYPPLFGDGHAASHIAQDIINYL